MDIFCTVSVVAMPQCEASQKPWGANTSKPTSGASHQPLAKMAERTCATVMEARNKAPMSMA